MKAGPIFFTREKSFEISIFKCYFSGPPDPPANCSVVNQTTDSLEVECLAGFDGGLEQHFQLEVADLQTGKLLANDSDLLPEFVVSLLISLKIYMVEDLNYTGNPI